MGFVVSKQMAAQWGGVKTYRKHKQQKPGEWIWMYKPVCSGYWGGASGQNATLGSILSRQHINVYAYVINYQKIVTWQNGRHRLHPGFGTQCA